VRGCLSPSSVASILAVAAIVLADLLIQVCNEGDLHAAKTALLTGGVDPSKVDKLAIHRGTNDLQGERDSGHEHASQPILRNSSARSEKAMISVGQTKVKSRG
jgi:hypothetical protein